MGPSRGAVRAAARLARLSFTPQELDRLAEGLATILAHVDVLRDIDTPVAPESVPGSVSERSDEPGADPLHEPPSYTAPEWRGGYFTVPRVITPPQPDE